MAPARCGPSVNAHTTTLHIGYATGAVARWTISNGGGVTSSTGDAYLGNKTGATGTVLVTGAGSSWTNSGALFCRSLRQRHIANHHRRQGHRWSRGQLYGQLPRRLPDRPSSTALARTWNNSGGLFVGKLTAPARSPSPTAASSTAVPPATSAATTLAWRLSMCQFPLVHHHLPQYGL